MIQLFDIKKQEPWVSLFVNPKEVLTKITHSKKVTTKFQTQNKSLDRKFQTPKRALHIPVTYIPEYPPWGVISNKQVINSRGGGEATRSGTEKRCSHNLQSGQSES